MGEDGERRWLVGRVPTVAGCEPRVWLFEENFQPEVKRIETMALIYYKECNIPALKS